MTKIITTEIIIDRLKNLNTGITLIGNYTKAKEKHMFMCQNDHIWLATPNHVTKGSGCPYCSNHILLSKEIINKKLKLENRNIQLIGEYKNMRTKSLFKCICSYEWYTTPDNIMHNHNCPRCSKVERKTKNMINDELKNNKRTLILLDELKNKDKKHLFRCICGYEWYATPRSILNYNIGCPSCENIILNEEILNERLNNRNIKMISEYNGMFNNAIFTCLICNHNWETLATNIFHKHSYCPECMTYGFKMNKPAKLYYVKFKHNDKYFYKIGVTNRNIKNRFKKIDYEKIETILCINYERGKDAFEKEQQLIKQNQEYLYKGEFILKSGNTEIFIKDIFR